MGGGVKGAKFERIGDSIAGEVYETPEVRQQTDLSTGQPKVWDDGRPQMQLVVTLKTNLHDEPDDDGLRRIFVKGKMTEAIREAVRRSGARGLEVGGQLTVRFTGEEPPVRRGFNPTKLYAAEYTRAATNQASAFLNSGGGQNYQTGQAAQPPF